MKKNKREEEALKGINLKKMGAGIDGKGYEIEFDAKKGESVLGIFAGHFLAMLDKEPKAANYLEMIGTDPKSGKRCVVTVRRYEGKTPAQLQKEAERDRDQLKELNADLTREIAILTARLKTYGYEEEKRQEASKADI